MTGPEPPTGGAAAAVMWNMRRLRGLRQMSGQDLGAAIGLPPGSAHATISRMETGDRQILVAELDALAKALGVTVPMLLDPNLYSPVA